MSKITIKRNGITTILEDGKVTSDVNKLVSAEYKCPQCGETYTVTFEVPDIISELNVETINIANQKCVICGEPVVLPGGSYQIDDEFRLVKKPALH